MNFTYSRAFDVHIMLGLLVTVNYTGHLCESQIFDEDPSFDIEVDSLDSFEIKGTKYLIKELDPVIQEYLFDRAYRDADKNLNKIIAQKEMLLNQL